MNTRDTVLCLAVLGVLTSACGTSSNQASQMTSFSAGQPEEKAELFTLSADQMTHVQIFTVVPAPLTRILRLTGAVAYNGFQTTPIITQVGGPVSRILAMPGEHVKEGQPLLFVTSPDFSLLRSAYIKARDAQQLAQKAYARAQDLFAHGAIAQADVEQAESNKAQAQADVESNEQSIRIVGITKPEDLINSPPPRELALSAPLAGEVVERLCSPGQVLQAGATQCFTISDMSRVWVLVNIYQNDIGFVKVGDPVTINNETYTDPIKGTIAYLGPTLDPTTRTLQARIDAANPGERLKKDMYVTADVQAGMIPDALLVPDVAILRDAQNMPYVYVLTGDRAFARRTVTIGENTGGRTQVLTGLQAGEKIVGDGGLFLQFQNSLQQ